MNEMGRFTAIIFFVGLALFSKCSESITSPDDLSPIKNFYEIEKQLEHAYKLGSQSSLDTAFYKWRLAIPPFTSKEIEALPDTAQIISEIFKAFYCPKDLERITNFQHENFETDFRYIVIQNSLNYAVVDTNPQFYYYKGVTISNRVIKDFRPMPDDMEYPVVYLSSSADSMIYSYLYQQDGTPKQDHQQRVDFLRKAIQLTHNHWMDDYHKVTMPIASYIYINEKLNKALVTFRVFYQFGNTYLEKLNNKWVIINSKITAIE